jgi:glycosyltransferase involved in cell wall biosynthesis
MRIFFLTSKLNFRTSGGSVEEIDYIIRNLLKLGHEVTVVTVLSGGNDMPDPLPYKVIEEQAQSGGLIDLQRKIYTLLKKYSNDADFFLTDAHNFMYGAGLYRLTGGKVPVGALVNQFLTCWSPHVSSYFPQAKEALLLRSKKRLRRLIEKYIGSWFANFVDIYAFVSPNVRAVYEDFWGRHRPQDFVIGDPIDITLLMHESGVSEMSYRERLKRKGPLTLFYSSRMAAGKGFDMFLQGFARVTNKDDFRVILGGTGPEEQYVQEMVNELHLEKYVTLPGWVTKEQLFAYYREADIFIQADWWVAGTSISVLYALVFGVPSILPGGGGLEWNAGASAVYFPYRDPEGLARRIEELGADHELRGELSENCYKRLAEDDMNYPELIAKFAKRMEETGGREKKP